MGLEIGRAFFAIAGDTMGLTSSVDQARPEVERQMEGMADSVGTSISSMMERVTGSVTGMMALITAKATVVAGTMKYMAHSFAGAGDAIDKMSYRTGVGREALQELEFAAQQSGASIRDVERSIRRLHRRMDSASPRFVESLEKLGVRLDDLKRMKPEDQFTKLINALGGIEDPTKRAGIAMQVLGRSGTRLAPMMAEGAEGLSKLREEAIALGIIMSEEQIKLAAEMTDAWNRFTRQMGAAKNQIGAAVVPVLIDLTDNLQGILRLVTDLIQENEDLVRGLFYVAAAVAKVTAACLTLKIALAVLYAHPVIAGFAALTAVVAYLSWRMGEAERIAGRTSRAVQDATKWANEQATANRSLRTEDERRMRRLEELHEIQRREGALTESQTKEAVRLVEELGERGKSFGITIDENTGKITGMAGAMEKMVDLHRELAELDIARQVRANRVEMRQLDEDIQRASESWHWTTGQREKTLKEIEGHLERQRDLTEDSIDLQQMLNALRRGEDPAGARVDEDDGLPDEGMVRNDRAEAAEAQMEERLHRLRAEQIEDEHERKMELMKQRHQREIDEAREVEADTSTLRSIHEMELAALQEKLDNERADRLDRLRGDIEDRIARAQIQLEHADDPIARQIATLQFEKTAELDALNEIKGLGGEQLREAQEMIKQLYQLREEGLEQSHDLAEVIERGLLAQGRYGIQQLGSAVQDAMLGGDIERDMLNAQNRSNRIQENLLKEEKASTIKIVDAIKASGGMVLT